MTPPLLSLILFVFEAAVVILSLDRVVMLRTSRPLWPLQRVIPSPRSSASLARRSYASAVDLSNYPKPGDKLYGFTVKRTEQVPEFELAAIQLQHDKTGAEYLHIGRDDSNNVFSIGFKTNPPDATGVPHILEHTTLCGSEKYPVRDPFFKMLPRSLSNFMNAFTSADHTTYPFATTNAQDFRNLMSVYLDATLHPLLNRLDFTQEGWRIGPENPLAVGPDGQSESPLVFKGVVYNEMKGQMSDASYLYYIRFHEHLVPALNNSGGDPPRITDLTYDQLKAFHAEHYHPSNSKILTYGDLPLEDHLKKLSEVLAKFEHASVDGDIKLPIDLSEPQSVTVPGPLDPLIPADAQYKTSVTWSMGNSMDMVERFSLSVLSSLLLDGYGSPFYQGLIEAGLGSDFTPNTGFNAMGKASTFSVGLTGVKKDAVKEVRKRIDDIILETCERGFDKIKVDGILHQLELGLKHKTANFGMGLMQRLKPDWFNGIDPFDSLAFQRTLDGFKERYAKGRYLEELLETYLLNDRVLIFTMEPSASYGEALAAEETARLDSKIHEVSSQFSSPEEAKRHLEKQELELLDAQENARQQDLSCLPTVHVSDIPRVKPTKEVRFSSLDNVKVQWREAPTNGLTYFRAVHKLDGIPDELRELIPLFTDSIMRLGTRNMTMEKLEELIKLKTGGISVSYHSSTSPHNLRQYEEGFVLSGRAFDRNVPAMYDLLRMLILETDFDSPEAEKKILQLLQSSAHSAMDTVAEAGHAYARRYAMAGLSPEGQLREQTSGLTNVKLTTLLATRTETGALRDVIQKLRAIQSFAISNTQSLRVALNCDADSSKSNRAMLSEFLGTLPSNVNIPSSQKSGHKFPRNAKTFFPLPYQVYYSSVVVPTVPYVNSAGASLQVLSQLLTHKHLHHEIREKGGAYGGGAFSLGLNGIFGMMSYRDPNPQNTLNIMSEAGTWARDRNWTERDLEEAKLSVFQALDAPESVSQEGMTQFLSGVDPEMQQRRREQLLDVTAKDVKKAANEFLVKGAKDASTALLGAPKEWTGEQSGWIVKDLGMETAQLADPASDIAAET
ncbi:presequence protease-like protein [Trichodelitschia bisporula]|uniref:Presequence protease, mitochondrial n=1 Tax=Trichodelitschia bisporula TaxID=703511 RepID=A0A6G1IA99_9PEZI|nr:presequence protease-like protein [Trichodelitschia bisporula]